MSAASHKSLVQTLGHDFRDPGLLGQALTHPSAATSAHQDNQRLEFLGDRVLGLVVAQALVEAFPNDPEGELAPRFNALVRRETLAEIAEEVGLGQHLRLGRSESMSGGRRKSAILADAMEAVIAALYLDGGMDVAAAFIQRRWSGRLKSAAATQADAKTRLQEWAQGRGEPTPDYTVLRRSGPDHAPVFLIEVRLENGRSAQGEAGSKKLAEQGAAAALLAEIQSDD